METPQADPLILTQFNLGISPTSGGVVVGLVASVRHLADEVGVCGIQLTKNGTDGVGEIVGVSAPSGSYSIASAGSATSISAFGVSLTIAELNDPSFGILLHYANSGEETVTFSVDAATLTAYVDY